MKSPTRSPEIRRATKEAAALGYRVEYADYLESPTTPGVLGRLAGLCDKANKVIRVRTRWASRHQIAVVIRHELEHAEGKERGTDHPELDLRCGGMI